MHDANCHATHICGKLNFKRCTGEAQFRRRRMAVAGKTDAYLLSVIRGHRQTDDRQTDASTKIKAEKTPFQTLLANLANISCAGRPTPMIVLQSYLLINTRNRTYRSASGKGSWERDWGTVHRETSVLAFKSNDFLSCFMCVFAYNMYRSSELERI